LGAMATLALVALAACAAPSGSPTASEVAGWERFAAQRVAFHEMADFIGPFSIAGYIAGLDAPYDDHFDGADAVLTGTFTGAEPGETFDDVGGVFIQHVGVFEVDQVLLDGGQGHTVRFDVGPMPEEVDV